MRFIYIYIFSPYQRTAQDNTYHGAESEKIPAPVEYFAIPENPRQAEPTMESAPHHGDLLISAQVSRHAYGTFTNEIPLKIQYRPPSFLIKVYKKICNCYTL